MKKLYILVATLLISAMSFGQVAGDVIITEIMQNPNTVADGDGEYFEIYNTTGTNIDLNGWTITDNGSDGHTVSVSLIIPANAYLVLGVNTDSATNGNVPVDYSYGTDITLSNSADELILTAPGSVEIDRVEYDGGTNFPDPVGKSMNLNLSTYSHTDNDNGLNWCESTTAMGSQFGTPGAENETCAAPCLLDLGSRTIVCDAITVGEDTYSASIDFSEGNTGTTYVITTSSGTVSGDDPSTVADGTINILNVAEGTNINVSVVGGTCDLSVSISSPVCVPATCTSVGSVIFTEIMQNPSVPVSDSQGEWFELYNTTLTDIDLQGWSIVDDSNSSEGFVIPNSLIIPAEGYLLFANNGDSTINGGLPTPDYVYTNGFPYLGNSTDGLVIQCSDSIIDEVIWDNGATFPDPNGASMSLNVAHLNATDNDDGANWSEAEFIYGTGQFGTPGGVNDMIVNAVNQNEISGFAIYPNPVNNGEVTITSDSVSMKTIQLFNVIGEMVVNQTIDGAQIKLKLNELNSGIYIVKVIEGNNSSISKLIIK